MPAVVSSSRPSSRAPGSLCRIGAGKRASFVPHRRHADQASQVHRLAPLAARHVLQASEHVRAVRAHEHELRRPDQRFYVRTIIIADLADGWPRRRGARLAVQSAYRSYANQKATFDYWVRVDGARPRSRRARAGHSEHQLGTTLDFRSYGGSAPWNYSDWATTKAGAWLKANAWKYGFIMSYPKGKSAVTCYAYEPWHYRYVGRDVAAKVRASKLTLREYLEAADRHATAADTHAHANPVADPAAHAESNTNPDTHP